MALAAPPAPQAAVANTNRARRPQSAKLTRASTREVRNRAISIRIGSSEPRSRPIASAKRLGVTIGATRDHASYKRASPDCATGTSTGRQHRSETLAAALHRRIFRAPDSAPQLRREFRRR
jgi:hypothetical protein